MSEKLDRPIDLSAIDPSAHATTFERTIGSITAAATDQLAARRANVDAIVLLARWRRPMLAAAAIAALISGTILATVRVPDSFVAPETDGIAEAMGVPAAVAQWMASDQLPTTADLLSAF